MAWLLHQAPEGFAVVPVVVEPPLRERQISVEWYRSRRCGFLYGNDGTSGLEIPESAWPKHARLKTTRKALPHITNFSSLRAVSQAVKDLIEALEPDVHDFRHVEVVQKDGTQYPEAYFAFHCRRRFDDIVIWEESTVYSKEVGDRRRFRLPYSHERVVIDGAGVWGAHCWITSQMMGPGHTVSEELFSQLTKRKLLRGIMPTQFFEK